MVLPVFSPKAVALLVLLCCSPKVVALLRVAKQQSNTNKANKKGR